MLHKLLLQLKIPFKDLGDTLLNQNFIGCSRSLLLHHLHTIWRRKRKWRESKQ